MLKFDCNKCSFKFLTDKLLTNHKKSHNRNSNRVPSKKVKTEKCKLCYIVLKWTGLSDHVKRVHPIDKKFLEQEITDRELKFHCSVCDKKFVSKLLLNAHSRQHELRDIDCLREKCQTEDNKSKCLLCYTVFPHFLVFSYLLWYYYVSLDV